MERQQPISESAEVDVPLPSDATVECAGERDKTEPLDIHRTVTGMSPNGVARKSKSTTPSQGGSESVAVPRGKRASSRTSAVSQTERITITPNRTSESDSGSKPSLSSTSQRRTDEILPQISMHVGELLRASEEKVNLAQAAYDSVSPFPTAYRLGIEYSCQQVDRHVRLLDQAIREQESRLPADSRSRGGLDLQTTNGTFTLSSCTPLENGLYMLADAAQEEDEATVLTNGRMPTEKTSRQKRGHRRKVLEGSRSRPAPEEVNTTSGPVGVMGAVLGVPDATSVLSDMPINPNEPRYCYCNEFSFGEVIRMPNFLVAPLTAMNSLLSRLSDDRLRQSRMREGMGASSSFLRCIKSGILTHHYRLVPSRLRGSYRASEEAEMVL